MGIPTGKSLPTPGLNDKTAASLGASMSLGGDSDALASYYDAWADEYDDDVGGENYGLPASVMFTLDAAIEVVPRLAESDLRILDAGCGTGRVGVELARRGYSCVDGVDLSPAMAARAVARGVYRTVEAGIDLTAPLPPRWKRSAELVTIGGVFTVGHIPPIALHNVAELVERGGVLIVTVRPGYFNTTNYGEVSDALIADGSFELLAYFDDLSYTEDSHGLFYAYRVT